ncbi:MAG: hypothetical protein AB2392_23575 [Neobacillus sp.]
MLQIEKNNEVSVGGLGWYAFQGRAENLGWVKDEKNAEIRGEFKKFFDWFDEVGDEDNPNSIVLRISLTEGTITDNEKNTVNVSMKLILSIKQRNKSVKNKQFLTLEPIKKVRDSSRKYTMSEDIYNVLRNYFSLDCA